MVQQCEPCACNARGPARAGADDADDVVDADEDEPLRELSAARHIITVPEFQRPLCDELRAEFDGRTADARATSMDRFMWDPWHCPTVSSDDVTQYSLLRTQAAAYFPEQLHVRLADALLQYGEQQLVSAAHEAAAAAAAAAFATDLQQHSRAARGPTGGEG